MATHLDIDEQEKIDQLKAVWKRYGHLITGCLFAALLALAAWNGWAWWERSQALKAASLFDELDKAVQAGEVDRTALIFNDIKERYPRTAYAQQAGLLAAKSQHDQNRKDVAKVMLSWVGENAREREYKTIAHLRLASVLVEENKLDEALKQLDAADATSFEALVSDRRGDVFKLQGKKEDAVAAYKAAWRSMDAQVDYRRLIEAKLTSLGAAPEPAASASASAPRGNP